MEIEEQNDMKLEEKMGKAGEGIQAMRDKV